MKKRDRINQLIAYTKREYEKVSERYFKLRYNAELALSYQILIAYKVYIASLPFVRDDQLPHQFLDIVEDDLKDLLSNIYTSLEYYENHT